ncbi:MAG: zinc-ribbon domain-containing protein [Clostridia bacterium]|nr:zinc-ribbon domain-containing protein [Clostridia bacterium]
MGFLDQLGKKASDTMQTAKDKTNKLSSEMKLKSQFAEKKDRITVLYSEIGKEAYNNYTKGINEITDVISGKLKEISDINEALKGINKELLALKGIKVCPSCGEQIPAGSEFCPKCGNKVVEVTDGAPENATPVENENKE